MRKINPNCSSCNTLKTKENTYPKRNGFHTFCKKCYHNYFTRRWINKKLKYIKYLGGSCNICNYSGYYGALEFHHLDPSDKTCNWNKLRMLKDDTIKKELENCILVCANCHRELEHLLWQCKNGIIV